MQEDEGDEAERKREIVSYIEKSDTMKMYIFFLFTSSLHYLWEVPPLPTTLKGAVRGDETGVYPSLSTERSVPI